MAMSSISDNQKKRGRPATGIRPMVGFRADDEMTAALHAASAAERLPRAEIMRRAVADWLRERGYLKS